MMSLVYILTLTVSSIAVVLCVVLILYNTRSSIACTVLILILNPELYLLCSPLRDTVNYCDCTVSETYEYYLVCCNAYLFLMLIVEYLYKYR